MKLRDYQQSIYHQLVNTQADSVFQLDTGGGKTAIIAKLNDKPTINIAHRNFLVEQISQTLTLNKVPHKIIASPSIVKRCQLFQRNHNISEQSCEKADVYVGTIQSIIARNRNNKLNIDKDLPYQIIIDECHHVADGNMWAKLKDIFVNARFIGATATPCRLDGQGLHKKCGGLFDTLIQADALKENSVMWLIANNYLADYEAYSLMSLDMRALDDFFWDESTGEFYVGRHISRRLSQDFTKKELEKWGGSILVEVQGAIIEHYQKLADNKTAIVFCPSIEVAEQVSELFKKSNYVATYIASSLSLTENMRRIDAFKSGEVKILCNVEMATEGFDLPSAECLIVLRPTASLVLHRQMIGRVMRPKNNEQKAIIIDHVGNVLRHGLPDDEIKWTLTGTPKNRSERVSACDECGFVHNMYLRHCPRCGRANWLRSPDFEGVKAIELGYFDVELVRKMRDKIKQKDLQEQARIAEEKKQEQLKSEIVVYHRFHQYQENAVGKLCEKLSYWFLEHIKQSSIAIIDINRFLNHSVNFTQFWLDNFSINDLKCNDTKKNIAKCEKVLKKWLKSHS